MDFDREYQRPRRPDTPDDFTDSNVQALIEGRRKTAAPRPVVVPDSTARLIARAQHAQAVADEADRVRRSRAKLFNKIDEKPERDWHYDSQGYCDNPGRGY